MNELWNNYSALGYVILALENLYFPYQTIDMVTTEMMKLFDELTLDEAKKIYNRYVF